MWRIYNTNLKFMIIESKIKNSNQILAYTYMLYFNINDNFVFYYGVRYGNIRLKVSPINDIFKNYFTSSSSVHSLLDKGIMPFKIVIHKTFIDYKEACKYEVAFLSRINAKSRKDFLNQSNTFDNSLPNNLGRIASEEARKSISKASKKFQSDPEYRKYRSDLMKNRWKDPIFIEKMKSSNSQYLKSGKSKEAGAKSGNSRIGIKYSEEVKAKRSMVLKEVLKNIDMKARALKRKKYSCPICNLSNLDGGNFNRHMGKCHGWSKDQSSNFKFGD